MPAGLHRLYGKNAWHFVTFTCYQRRDFLDTSQIRDLFVAELDAVRARLGLQLGGYVVMPNHVHLLVSETPTPSVVLHRLKLSFSTKIRKETRAIRRKQFLSGATGATVLPPRFWEKRFFDLNVYTQQKKVQKLNYMHANPVTRGLVQHPRDWPWSSWSTFEIGATGLIRLDLR